LCPSLFVNLKFSSAAEAQTNAFTNGKPVPRGEPTYARGFPAHTRHHSPRYHRTDGPRCAVPT
jgi:hypothetical protein